MKNGDIMEKTKFYLITDTHYCKYDLNVYGDAYDDFMHYEQKCFAETQAINESVVEWLINADEADTVLIAGDLIFNGERENHTAFIELLNKLKASGKRVLVVTADHDFKEKREDCFGFDENGWTTHENTPREILFDLYKDFGFGDAIAVDKQHLSYVYQLSDGVRLLALNNDGTADGRRVFEESHIEWILEQTKKAREDGQMMFAMNHYPLLPGQPILSIVKSAYQKDAYEVTKMLADEGVHLVFTGHMHNMSVNCITTEKGNKFYDVCTGAIIADPAIIRLVSIEDEETVELKAIPTPDFDFDTKGKDCKQYLSDLFDNMIVNVLDDLAFDTERAMRKFHVDNKKLKPVLRFVGKRMQKLTFGGLAKLVHIKVDDSIKQDKVKDFAAELVRRVFEGNQPFGPDTPKGAAFIAFVNRMKPLFNKINAKGFDNQKADIAALLIDSAYNYDIDDYNAVLKLK